VTGFRRFNNSTCKRVLNLMNACTSDREIKHMFEKGSQTPRLNKISSKLIDEADKELMHVSKYVMEHSLV